MRCKQSAKRALGDLGTWFLNCIVGHIPCWAIRRSLYRLAGIKIGKGSRILTGAKIQGAKGISIGEHSYINSCCHLDGRGGFLLAIM